MRISIVLGPFYPTPPTATGAVQRIWYDLACEFARLGHDVFIAAKRSPGELKSEIGPHGMRIVRHTGLNQSSRVYFDILKDTWYSINAVARLPRSDIVVTNSFWSPTMLTPFQNRIGQVVTHIATAPKGQLFLYKGVAAIDTVSEAVRDQILAEAPWAADRLHVSYNPIKTDVFTLPPRPRDYTAPTPRTLLYTGRIHPTKGLHLLVEAYARLKRTRSDVDTLRLRLVGPASSDAGGGGEAYVIQLRELAGGFPLDIDPPLYDRRQLAEALQAAHYYAYPSIVEKGEAFGVAPLEAMACGLAPIVSDMPAFSAFLEHGINGLRFNHHADDPVTEFERALSRLLDEPKQTEQMNAAAAITAKSFSYEAAAGRHLSHFERLLAKKNGKTAS